MIYDSSHTNPMLWDEFDQIIDDMVNRIKGLGIVFDAITPILRSGGIPATVIANKMKIVSTIPVQVKYKYNPTIIEALIEPQCPKNMQVEDVQNILIVDANTGSGKSAQLVASLLNDKFPNAKLYFATVTKVYKEDNTVHGYKECVFGRITNESFLDSAPNDTRYGITIFPWESVDAELEDINA